MGSAFGKEISKNMNHNHDNNVECKGVLDAWKLLGKRWSLLILKNLNAKGSIRFNELKRMISGISSTVLADRLLELEREGLVTKKIYPEIPPRVEYTLTPRAKELRIVLGSLGNWARRWNSKIKISTGVQTGR
ncbi:MAG TPA: helix-turn-helix domain-containing protein [Candidatus Nitrosopolaris sp.]|nr:helix-turn-helix domain-containing protein [Candidatus Nitrosopolaris sp.]